MTDEELQILRDEIARDPLGRGYDAMSDEQLARSLNTADRAGRASVPVSRLRRYLALRGLYRPLKDLAGDAMADPAARAAAETALAITAAGAFETVDYADADVYGALSSALGALQSAGVLTAGDVTALLGLGDTLLSRTAELGLGAVGHLDIARIRRGGGATS